MSEWKLVKLNFGRNYAHFGELGIGIEETGDRVRSDTLFSAWVSTYARLFKKDAVEELLAQFPTEKNPKHLPLFQLSSTFIYREEGDLTIYYLPRPLQFPIAYPKDNDLDFFKTYKKLNYLPLEVWQRWYQGEGFTKSDRQELIDKTNKKESDGLLHKYGTFDYSKAYKIGQEPKIAVDRITRATNLYHTGFVKFQWKQNGDEIKSSSGLYFLVYFPEKQEQLAANLYAALYLLGEEGLGGERSSGAGRFEVEWLDLPETWTKVINPTKPLTHYCSIGLFWDNDPANLNQLITDTEDTAYEIIERGGWISSSPSGRQLRRKMVRMFAEGSVFPKQPAGKLVDVTPDEFITREGEYKYHPIYRCGIGLSLPIKISDSSKSKP